MHADEVQVHAGVERWCILTRVVTTGRPTHACFATPETCVLLSPHRPAPRYTLALDGITASSRLGRLLTINSPVLKQVGVG